MKINISEILKSEGESLNFSIEEKLWEVKDYPDVCEFLSPVKVKGTVTNLGDKFEVVGEGQVSASLNCGRCLSPVEHLVNFQVNENFSIAGKSKKETEAFFGNAIDLYPIVCQSLIIGLPMKVLCNEDCKGLCPSCGKSLNEGNCNCDTSKIDPRFESLRSLFKLDEEV